MICPWYKPISWMKTIQCPSLDPFFWDEGHFDSNWHATTLFHILLGKKFHQFFLLFRTNSLRKLFRIQKSWIRWKLSANKLDSLFYPFHDFVTKSNNQFCDSSSSIFSCFLEFEMIMVLLIIIQTDINSFLYFAIKCSSERILLLFEDSIAPWFL
jgi:hypothetical protein